MPATGANGRTQTGAARGAIAQAIQLPAEPRGRSRDRVRLARATAARTLPIIDRIHAVGRLPIIPLRPVSREPEFGGQYHYNRNTGRPTGIELNVATPNPEFTLVHEIGHFFDHQALGVPGRFASRTHPDLAEWRQVVLEADSCRTLHAGQSGGIHRDDRTAIDYLLRYTELWARSYATYLALKSGDDTLIAQLANERADVYPFGIGNWTDDDFVPVYLVIDRLLAQRGWLP